MFGSDNRFKMFYTLASNYGGNLEQEVFDTFLSTEDYENFHLDLIKEPMNIELSNLDFLEQGSSVCYASNTNCLIIGSDGAIHKCTCNLEDERNYLGNILDNGQNILFDLRNLKWCMPSLQRMLMNPCCACMYLPLCYSSFCAYKSNLQGECCRELYIKKYIDYLLTYYLKFQEIMILL